MPKQNNNSSFHSFSLLAWSESSEATNKSTVFMTIPNEEEKFGLNRTPGHKWPLILGKKFEWLQIWHK